jgi:hypothetical protein
MVGDDFCLRTNPIQPIKVCGCGWKTTVQNCTRRLMTIVVGKSGHNQIFDTLKIKTLPFFQINQLLSRYDVAAVQSTIGDMPGIIGPAMQSDRESLPLKIRQSSIEF